MRLILSFFSCLLLYGCSKTHPASYYLLHPEEIRPTYDQCVVYETMTKKQSSECEAVLKVIPLFKLYLTELITQPTSYGLKLMAAETKLVALQNALKVAKMNKDTQKILDLELAVALQDIEVRSRLAIIKLVLEESRQLKARN